MNRIIDIRNAINDAGLDAILLLNHFNRRFATGFPSSDGAVIITKDKAFFLTDSRYLEAARKSVKDSEVLDISKWKRYVDAVNEILSKCGVKTVGFEEESISFKVYESYRAALDAKLFPAESIIRNLRSVKTEEEVSLMQKAQDITDSAFEEILTKICGDLTEKQLAAEIIYAMLKRGADKISFDPIVVSGPNSSKPHGEPGDSRLKGFVTMDFGCVFSGYCSDMTRTVCLGKATDEMKEIYNTVLEAQKAGIAIAKGGVLGRDIDKAARDVISKAGYGKYFGHGFGHSVGLEVHDGPGASPSNDKELPAGYAVSAEPGIYIPERFGVRIEDVIVLTESGSINLTKSPKYLIEV